MLTADDRGKHRVMRTGTIYAIRNWLTREDSYVGQTVMPPQKRWNHHLCALQNGRHGSRRLQYAWSKYGPDAFMFEVLETGIPSGEPLTAREQFHIDRIGNLNHCRAAGSPLGVKRSVETLGRMSAARKGFAHSEATRASISILQKGRKLSETWKSSISASLKGRKHSAAHNAAVSAAHKGRIFTEATKETMKVSATAAWANRSAAQVAHLAVLAAAAKGRKLTEAQRAARSAATTAYYAKRKQQETVCC